ncbi:MAG: nucleoside-diphosphate kinase [Candidatus Melainabacteria bacterium]|nr:nucleoside-diphosphate kinase [Candidatus Melainabacteria bacterium]
MAVERTFVAVKPDGVERILVGEVVGRFEKRGLKLVGMKFMKVTKEMAEQHYGEHKGKPFYEGLVSYITSGPIVAMALEGTNAVALARQVIGATKPSEAAPGTIRGDLAVEIGRNIVHGSDSPENGQREIGIFFKPEEIVEWTGSLNKWIWE